MKTRLYLGMAGFLMSLLIILPADSNGQREKSIIKKYLSELSDVPADKTLQSYRMTAVYTNRDLYGKFIDKTKVSGDYTRGHENGFVNWQNVYITGSKKYLEPFPEGERQEYMENFSYIPSSKMLEADAFKKIPATPVSVFESSIWLTLALTLIMIFNYAGQAFQHSKMSYVQSSSSGLLTIRLQCQWRD